MAVIFWDKMSITTCQKVTLISCSVLCVSLFLPRLLLPRGTKEIEQPEGKAAYQIIIHPSIHLHPAPSPCLYVVVLVFFLFLMLLWSLLPDVTVTLLSVWGLGPHRNAWIRRTKKKTCTSHILKNLYSICTCPNMPCLFVFFNTCQH